VRCSATCRSHEFPFALLGLGIIDSYVLLKWC